tara:strand:- start:746 stop:943 length:198 start_codon:yes stop_codon:yes gene_type:complete
MTTKEALDKVKTICFAHIQELQHESNALKDVNKETVVALGHEVQQLSKAMRILTEYVSYSIDDGK